MTRFYSQSAKQVLDDLATSEIGLSFEEAAKRLKDYGLNKLPEPKSDSLIKIFLRQFISPLIYVLFGAAGIVFYLGEYTNGLIILFVVIFNAVVGAIQEGRANNIFQALRRLAETKAIVIRLDKEIIVPDFEVVPGDIIVLREGEKVPADAMREF